METVAAGSYEATPLMESYCPLKESGDGGNTVRAPMMGDLPSESDPRLVGEFEMERV